jgi:predicted Zn-ribbon and HTH transcriptional regulator
MRMGKVKIIVDGFKCERCRHEWIPRNIIDKPRVCPKCKSPYWDKPRKKPNV